jgi:hypothetical protein
MLGSNMFSNYGKLQLNYSTTPTLKITELGCCLAWSWPDPGLSHRAGAVSVVTVLVALTDGCCFYFPPPIFEVHFLLVYVI